MAEFKFTPESLSQTFITYRRQMIEALMLGMKPAVDSMSVMTGIRYKEVVAEIGGNFEFSNYKKDRLGTADIPIKGRELETFFGNCVQPIDPNQLYQTVWGANVTKGDGLKNTPIAVAVCAYIMKKLGENQFLNLFTAKHDASKDGTANWFNGFQTILEKDVTDGNISADEGNLFTFTDSIDGDNAEDTVKDFYWSAAPALRAQKLRLFISDKGYRNYMDAYQKAHGALPYNVTYEKKTLDGASNVEITPLACVPDDFLLLTPRQNIKLLYNQKSDDDRYLVERSLSNHYDVDFIANAFFGTQFLSVGSHTLLYGKKSS